MEKRNRTRDIHCSCLIAVLLSLFPPWAAEPRAAGLVASAQAEELPVHELMAAFIYKFTNFIDWPADPSGESSPFVITLFGGTVLLDELRKVSPTIMAKGRKVEVRQARSPTDLQGSEIVVVDTEDPNALKGAVQAVKAQGTLIISRANGFAAQGSMINLFVEQNRIRFEINRRALESAGLQASSQLLRLARLVE